MAKRKWRDRGDHSAGPPAQPSTPTAPVAAASRDPGRRVRIAIGFVGAVLFLASILTIAFWVYHHVSALPATRATPRAARSSQLGGVAPAYVTSVVCAECHPGQRRRWSDSHHEQAMQPATTATVRGDFDNNRAVTSRFFHLVANVRRQLEDARGSR